MRKCIDQLHQLTNRIVILFISRNLPLNEIDYSEICGLSQVEYIYQLGSNISCRRILIDFLLNKYDRQNLDDQNSEQRFVLTNSFVSGSIDKNVALAFNTRGRSRKKTDVALLIKIEIASNCMPLQPMAFLDRVI